MLGLGTYSDEILLGPESYIEELLGPEPYSEVMMLGTGPNSEDMLYVQDHIVQRSCKI